MAGLFEAGFYSIRDTKKWLIWIAIFGVIGYLSLREKEPFIPQTTSLVAVKNATSQSFEDPYHADLIRVD